MGRNKKKTEQDIIVTKTHSNSAPAKQTQAAKVQPASRAQKKASSGLAAPKKSSSRPPAPKKPAAKPSTPKKKAPAEPVKKNVREKTAVRKKLRIIPIGGLHEIGKNMTVLEYGNDMIIIDCGMAFPDEEMLGIDVVIPDFSYVCDNADKLRGLVITHGHEDHIGGIPYLLKRINVPVYGTDLTLGLIKSKLAEHRINADLRRFSAGDTITLGHFKVEAVHTTHSIADSLALSIDTPVGRVFHTGDFKVDFTPVYGEPIDIQRYAQIGAEGVLLLMCDSTNAMKPGYSASERNVGISLGNIFAATSSRIIIATFSSNVNRVQKIVDLAKENGRKVAVSGRSMENMVRIASELGYLKMPAGTLIDSSQIKNYKDSELVIITTGSQGEPMSALTRMANNEHKQVKLKAGDTIILSSNPIPGNEKTVIGVVNKLFEIGARIIYNDIAETHVSGHACREELKLVHSLIKPKFFMPVHGEVMHLKSHAAIAESLGMSPGRIIYAKNGDVIEISRSGARITGEKAPAEPVMVDGYGIGDIGTSVLGERKNLSENGLVVISAVFDSATGEVLRGPELYSKGFLYVKEYGHLLDDARLEVVNAMEKAMAAGKNMQEIKQSMVSALKNYIYKNIDRTPVIVPAITEV